MAKTHHTNLFLTAPTGGLFARNALPLVIDMSIGGLLQIMDGMFLGHYVGAKAVAAVSIVFPVVMIIIATSSLICGGMSSLFARQLGAGEPNQAAKILVSAHGLALSLAMGIMVTFLIGGNSLISLLMHRNSDVAEMAYTFLFIITFATPIQFIRDLHSNALRNEGLPTLAASTSIIATFANILFNYLLIHKAGWGIAGSATGTVLAQLISLITLIVIRHTKSNLIPLSVLRTCSWKQNWLSIIKLGAPLSLSFIGMALSSFTIIMVLRLTDAHRYLELMASYGVVSRIGGFTYLPIMAIGLAMQSLVGHNVGARLYQRSNSLLMTALGTAAVYCLVVELAFWFFGASLSAFFVTDTSVILQAEKILHLTTLLYLTTGPVLVGGLYFQAIGRPQKASWLTLSKPFLFMPCLTAILGFLGGERLIWFASPIADGLMIALGLMIAGKIVARGHIEHGIGLVH